MSFAASTPVVYVIEPYEDLREAVATLLVSSGFVVRSFADPSEAIPALCGPERMPSVIILEAVLPGIGAWGFRRLQRLITRAADIPLVMTSGLDDVEQHATACGAFAYFKKPVDPSELRAIVEQCAWLQQQRDDRDRPVHGRA